MVVAMKHPTRNNAFPIAVSCCALMIILPTVSAIGAGDYRGMNALVTAPDINVTNESFTNRTIPHTFLKGPEPINVQIALDETLLPAPKGEMALGPRTIGFSTGPASLVILIIAACVVVAGAWFVMMKKQR